MAKLSQSLVERFFDSVGTTAQEVYNSSPADLTIDAEIVSIVNAGIGEYKINYQGNIMSAFSNDVTIIYKTGERVYVTVPQGDMSKKKLILGRSSYQNSAETQNDLKNFFVDKGPNWIERYSANSDLGICACPKDNEKELTEEALYAHYGFIREVIPDSEIYYVDSSGNKKALPRRYNGVALTKSQIEIIDSELATWSRSNDYLKIQATFRTEFSGLHSTGKYMVQVACLQRNPRYVADPAAPDYVEGEDPYKIITYELNFSNFDGVAPYSMSDPSTQRAYFKIPNGGIIGIYSIGLIQDGDLQFDIPLSFQADGMPVYNPNLAIKNKNNIFISDIQICFAEQVNLSTELYYPYIEAPYGTTIYQDRGSGFGRSSVELIAHLKYGNVDITDDEHCRIHWFRQKADVTMSSAAGEEKDEFGKTFFDYSGPGWYPVERIDTEQQSVTGDDRLYKVDGKKLTIYLGAVPWKWKYKAVITYSAPVKGDNGEVKEVEITSQYAIQEVNRGDTKYNLELLSVETDLPGFYEIVNHADVLGKRDWYGTWFEKGLDDSYNTISAPFHLGKFNILDNPFAAWSTILVQCYDPDMYIPGRGFPSDAYEVGVLELDVGGNELQPFIINWIGDDHFQYDAQGTWRGEKENKKYTLTPILKFSPGCAFNYAIKVTAPDGKVLGDRLFYDKDYLNGWNSKNSLVKDVWIDSYFGINFSVENKYDKVKAEPKNNTFTITVYTDRDEIFTFEKQITFSKDGDLGTNGTEWNVLLKPCKWKAKDAMGLFVEPYPDDELVPLVVEPDGGSGHYKQNNNYRLFLRPYVSKGGTPIEELDKEQAFFYTCSWDVRSPGSDSDNNKSDLASYLRLYHSVRGSDGVAPRGEVFNNVAGGGWETGDMVKIGSDPEDIKVNSALLNSDGTGKNSANGLVAHTVYPLSPEARLWTATGENPFLNPEKNECYGAVEVVYFDNADEVDGTGASLEEMKYRFIVKCTIDICRGSYNYITHSIETTAYSEVVTTLVSYYAVDVFFDEDQLLTDVSLVPEEMIDLGRKIRTNWPTTVKYDAIGYNPEHADERLYFHIGPGDYENEPDYLPITLTPETIDFEKFSIVSEDEPLGEKPKTQYYVKFRPINHLTKDDGYHGAYRTKPGDWPVKPAGAAESKGWFLRNAVLYYNRFGNADINGWDGQGLDTNEENGTIFGVTFGAGWKGKFSNAFTGILMGVDKNVPRSKYQEGMTDLKYPEEAEKSHPYLTGLFGYQEGIQSFGLLENGTAFFGRADRGGRIIVDGSNATIYGGANGLFKDPSIADPMWNSLRINLIDLTHQKNGELWELDPNVENELIYTGAGSATGYKVRDLNGNSVKLNLGGKSFGFTRDDSAINDSQKIPDWYAKMWRRAYIQPFKSKPYWMLLKDSGSGDKVPYEITDLGWWDGSDINVSDPDDISNNRRINFFDTAWININDLTVLNDYSSDSNLPSIDYPDGTTYPPEDYPRFPYLPPVDEDGTSVSVGIPSICIWDTDASGEKTIIANPDNPNLKARLDYLRKTGAKLNLSCFGSQRASTTPAIEIGQHIPGLRPGLLDWQDHVALYQSLRVPGDRNFMVTYDGTLWAMNGVFMGNVIGANIVGGRMQASQIGVGPLTTEVIKNLPEIYTFYDPSVSNLKCDWTQLVPPEDAETSIDDLPASKTGYSMTMDQNGISTLGGEVVGGAIDVGRFHIIGSKTIEKIENYYGYWPTGTLGPKKDQIGHLIQTGKSDFIGLTHFYGNVGIAPSLSGVSDRSNSGSLVQIGGFTALGVILPRTPSGGLSLVSHQYIDDFTKGISMTRYYAKPEGSSVYPDPSTIGYGESVEQSAIFAIESRGSDPIATDFEGQGVLAHFWPLHFRSKREYNVGGSYSVDSFVTTMDQFKAPVDDSADESFATHFEGSNYFRISRYGLETQELFIRNRFQPEAWSGKPAPNVTCAEPENVGATAYKGYFGQVSRAGPGTGSLPPEQGALGITTWNGNALILHSDSSSAWRSRKTLYLASGYQTDDIGRSNTFTEKYGDRDYMSNVVLEMGSALGNGSGDQDWGPGIFNVRTIASPCGFTIYRPETGLSTAENTSSPWALGNPFFNGHSSVRAAQPIGAGIAACFTIDPCRKYIADKTGGGSAAVADYGKPAIILGLNNDGCGAGENELVDGGGIHIICAPKDANLLEDCREAKWTETFWSENEIHSWAKTKNGIYSASKAELGIAQDGVHKTGTNDDISPILTLHGDPTAEDKYILAKINDTMKFYAEECEPLNMKQVMVQASEDQYLDFNVAQKRTVVWHKKEVTGLEIEEATGGSNFFVSAVKDRMFLDFYGYDGSNPTIHLAQNATASRQIQMTDTEFRIEGYTAEQQFGIYARFA